MKSITLDKNLQEFNNSAKSEGACCINSLSGDVELASNLSNSTQQTLDLIKSHNGFKNLNNLFASIFPDRELPELITIKTDAESRFIKFIDNKYLIYSIIKKEHINYNKIKIEMKKIA